MSDNLVVFDSPRDLRRQRVLKHLIQRAREDADLRERLRHDLEATLTKQLGRKPTAEELESFRNQLVPVGPDPERSAPARGSRRGRRQSP